MTNVIPFPINENHFIKVTVGDAAYSAAIASEVVKQISESDINEAVAKFRWLLNITTNSAPSAVLKAAEDDVRGDPELLINLLRQTPLEFLQWFRTEEDCEAYETYKVSTAMEDETLWPRTVIERARTLIDWGPAGTHRWQWGFIKS